MTAPSSAYWSLAAVCFFWGTTYIAIRIGVRDVPPLLMGSVRFLLAGAALLGWARSRGQAFPGRKDARNIVIVALALPTAGFGSLSWAQQWVPAGLAALLVAALPFWMLLFGALAGERFAPRALAGLAVGFLGLAVILWPDLARLEPGDGFLRGVAVILSGSCVWAMGSIYSKKHPVRTGALMTAGLQNLLAGVFLAGAGLAGGEAARWAPTPASWGAILYLAVFGTIVGYTCYIHALSHLPTDVVSVYAYANPVVAVVLGVLILDERIDFHIATGTPLVLIGIWLVNTARGRREPLPVTARRRSVAL